ncbi:MAG: multifunctional 2',3'-cyclic-nucleotide 2'-phosphodiesterase/5'-nucleotidase/3'-nucleotidase [Boseongicola sp. SB0677_bin_26]|nr:multifunctional 2',3'-cyclic-nucleotide 2'-phosphodiesterase/5'-nucleotidase/3'-nucleotidase [Boseongicola sp. SB0665_bin_10]MYG24849.1 multifunctional 2',3'-cyclic-nucleotide 2'-phosphodiesterase/5'-nucleotidase/3'-nucleotidase [Boseongicola sp. SB0677_bin_26]
MNTRVFCATALLALGGGMASADYRLTVLHTNDFHARFEPISRFDSGCGPEDNEEGKCFGGSARLVSAIEAAKARSDNYILVDGGDQFQGSLFYTYYKGKAAAEMMNKMGYDAMAVGNHEFDDGPEVLRAFVDSVDFPVLMANSDFEDEPFLVGAIEPSVILERAGERLGLIGLTPEDNDELASPGPNVLFSDPVEAVRDEVKRLEAMGINKIIVLSHSGLPVDLRIAEAVPQVDVIVGGHDNTLLSNTQERADGPYPLMVGNTAIVQAYAYGKFLGEIDITFDGDGNIVEAVGEPILIDASVAEDESTKKRVGELAGPLDEIRNKVVAEAGAFIEGGRAVCRVEECPLGNLVADSMLDRVRHQGIQIAIANAGGIRASIDEGDVTMGQVLTVLPFQNTLATFRIKGQSIIDALENGVSQVEEVKGRFPQVAGLSFTWDPTVGPNEGRIQEVLVGDEAIDPEAIYGVVTNNYVRNGGDGYRMFTTDAMDVYDFGPDLADVLAEYMAARGPVAPKVEGRISRLE